MIVIKPPTPAEAAARNREILDRLLERRRLAAAEMRTLRNGNRQRELADQIVAIDRSVAAITPGALTREMVPGRGGMGYVTRGMGGRRR